MAMQLLEPFANDGLREDFDINPSLENDMSINKGFTALFQLKPEEGGKFIDMLKFNQLLYLMSKANVEFTTQSFPNWIDDKGDGTPYAYPKNAIVKYTNGNNYVSLVNNNTQVPTGTNWKIFDITALDNTVKLSGNQTIAGVKTFSSSPIVPTPTTGTQAVNKAYVDSRSALPIGAILNGYTIFDNCIVAFGGEFNRADYPKLWAYLQASPSLVKTEAQWTTENTTNGMCGFFSDGNGTTTFRVPNLDKAFLRPDSRGAGSYQGDAIRNITGSASLGGHGLVVSSSVSGVFDAGPANLGNLSASSLTSSALLFDASKVVPTSNENRPKNIAVLPLIVAK